MADSEIWPLGHPSQEFEVGPRITYQRCIVTVEYDYELPDGSYTWESFSYSGVVSCRFPNDSHCTADQISAYDTVMRVQGADRELPNVSLFRIYFDEIGCLEVWAESFQPPDPT